MSDVQSWRRNFAVHGIFWRKGLDWAVLNIPSFFHPFLIFFWTVFFFFFAAPARKAVLGNLALILPGSRRLANYFRTFRIFRNFGWTLTDATAYKLLKAKFTYELSGDNFLRDLAVAPGAIILTAHMGNYDLGAAVFVEKFNREIRMIRAPEPDEATAQHVDHSIEQFAAGAVKVDYSTRGASLPFELLNALRRGEIISIQGDRVVGEVAHSPVRFFGSQVPLPSGPFVLSFVSKTPIYPLFITRAGYRRYKIIAREPIMPGGTGRSRDDEVTAGMQQWGNVLESTIRDYWDQWFAFTPICKAPID